jgi:hypothetical protein
LKEASSENFTRGTIVMQNLGIPRRPIGSKENEKPPVNWRRGLIRVWLLISAAWILAWTIALVLNGIQGDFKTAGDFLQIPVLLLGPPISVFILGLAAGWALRGFSVDR